ncbi:MotA/TolQ/ExbB proton channel family protein [Akkermansiaceae bacterium]|nr:MotA/TolQ/ExbB proton channel family protein [Akkermansiaceae bacterium]
MIRNISLPKANIWTVASAVSLLASSSAMAAEKNALERFIFDGGPLTIFIVAVGLLSLISLTVFNFMNLTKAKYAPDDLKAALMDHMVNCRVRSAIELSASHPSYLGRMMAYSLPNIDATPPEDLGRERVEDAIADFSINETRKQMTFINMISLVAQSAPMLGLFGTVFGMIKAFGTLATNNSADPHHRREKLCRNSRLEGSHLGECSRLSCHTCSSESEQRRR